MRSRSATGVPPCRSSAGTARAARCAVSRRAIATYWVKTSAEPSSARRVSSSSSSRASLPERPRAAVRAVRSSFRYCAGWLQICLSAVEQLQDQAAPGDALRASRSPSMVSRTTASYRRGLFAGERDGVVGLGLGRQLGRDARVGLLAAQQERADQAGQPARRPPSSSPFSTARACRARKDFERAEQSRGRPVEERPQLGEVVLHGGAGEGDARGGRDGAQRLGGRGVRVLDVLRLVGDDHAPGAARRAARRRTASCRRW